MVRYTIFSKIVALLLFSQQVVLLVPVAVLANELGSKKEDRAHSRPNLIPGKPGTGRKTRGATSYADKNSNVSRKQGKARKLHHPDDFVYNKETAANLPYSQHANTAEAKGARECKCIGGRFTVSNSNTESNTYSSGGSYLIPHGLFHTSFAPGEKMPAYHHAFENTAGSEKIMSGEHMADILLAPTEFGMHAYPSDYGDACWNAWDEFMPPFCDKEAIDAGSKMQTGVATGRSTLQSLCGRVWCYVDPNDCLGISRYPSSIFLGRYYSYETCDAFKKKYLDKDNSAGVDAALIGGKNQAIIKEEDNLFLKENTNAEYEFSKAVTATKLQGRKLRFAYPASQKPWHYKNGYGDTYTAFPAVSAVDKDGLSSDGKGEWRGIMHELFKNIALEAGFQAIEKQVSTYSQNKYKSPVDACINDVRMGLIDICPTAATLVKNRMEMATFATPIMTGDLYLVVPVDQAARTSALWNPWYEGSITSESFYLSYWGMVFRPFSPTLWLLTFIIALVFGILVYAIDGDYAILNDKSDIITYHTSKQLHTQLDHLTGSQQMQQMAMQGGGGGGVIRQTAQGKKQYSGGQHYAVDMGEGLEMVTSEKSSSSSRNKEKIPYYYDEDDDFNSNNNSDNNSTSNDSNHSNHSYDADVADYAVEGIHRARGGDYDDDDDHQQSQQSKRQQQRRRGSKDQNNNVTKRGQTWNNNAKKSGKKKRQPEQIDTAMQDEDYEEQYYQQEDQDNMMMQQSPVGNHDFVFEESVQYQQQQLFQQQQQQQQQFQQNNFNNSMMPIIPLAQSANSLVHTQRDVKGKQSWAGLQTSIYYAFYALMAMNVPHTPFSFFGKVFKCCYAAVVTFTFALYIANAGALFLVKNNKVYGIREIEDCVKVEAVQDDTSSISLCGNGVAVDTHAFAAVKILQSSVNWIRYDDPIKILKAIADGTVSAGVLSIHELDARPDFQAIMEKSKLAMVGDAVMPLHVATPVNNKIVDAYSFYSLDLKFRGIFQGHYNTHKGRAFNVHKKVDRSFEDLERGPIYVEEMGGLYVMLAIVTLILTISHFIYTNFIQQHASKIASGEYFFG